MLNLASDYGLLKNDLIKICRVFQQFPQIHKVIIFGSRAKGNFRSSSDIDMTIAESRSVFQIF